MGSLLEPCDPIGVPHVGDVIVCEAFANGWQQCSEPGVPIDAPIWVTDAQELPKLLGDYRRDCRDASRAQAAYVVEACGMDRNSSVKWKKYGKGGGYGDPFDTEEDMHAYAISVTARRLAADGTYDPEGERIRFEVWGNGPSNDRPGISDCMREVRRSGAVLLVHTIVDTPMYRLRTMRQVFV